MKTVLALDTASSTGYCYNTGNQLLWGTKKFTRRKGRKHIPDEHEGIREMAFMLWILELRKTIQPDEIVIERFGHFASYNAAALCIGFQAMVVAVASRHNIPIYRYSPNTIKKFATGKGDARKEMMKKKLMEIEPLLLTASDDAIDAFALHHYHRTQREGG